MEKMLKLGIPNGSLYEPTLKLLSKVGVTILAEGRNFRGEVLGFEPLKHALIMRPQDIPEAILDGVIDVGFCGWDCVVESGLEKKLVKVEELNYSRKSSGPVRVVVFGKKRQLVDGKNVLVASEYPNIAKAEFRKAKVRFSHGSTEVKVAGGNYDYGVCITESGQSLADNGLKILKTLLVSPTVLMAKRKIPEIRFFGELLAGALQAEKYVLVKMNVDEKKKDRVVKMLPALNSPTVDQRADGSYAIETVAKKSEIADLVVALKKLDASGILVQDINVLL